MEEAISILFYAVDIFRDKEARLKKMKVCLLGQDLIPPDRNASRTAGRKFSEWGRVISSPSRSPGILGLMESPRK
jgi:hypothetical protein